MAAVKRGLDGVEREIFQHRVTEGVVLLMQWRRKYFNTESLKVLFYCWSGEGHILTQSH